MEMLTLCLNTENNRHSEWPDCNHTILFLLAQVCHNMQCRHGVTLEFMKTSFSGTFCYLVICVWCILPLVLLWVYGLYSVCVWSVLCCY